MFDLIDSSMGILTCTNLVFQNIRNWPSPSIILFFMFSITSVSNEIEVLVMFVRLVSSNGLHVNAFVTILTSLINASLNAFVSS